MLRSTKSIRTALTTMRGALAAGDLPRVRNAARFAFRALGKADLLPRASAPVETWQLAVRAVEASLRCIEAERAEERALFARNAAA